MFKATLAAMAMVAFCALAGPTHFISTAQAWTCDSEDTECNGGGEEGGGVSSQPSSQPEQTDNGEGGPAGNGGDLAPPTTLEKLQQIEQTCNGALQQLAKVPEKLVVSFSNESAVSVIAVCNSGLGHKASIDASQALPLQSAIAANPALAAALQQRGYHAEDVVGVILTNRVATLYVHKNTA